MQKFRDFDQFLNELKASRPSFKLFDQTYYLPASLPALVLLELAQIKDRAPTEPAEVLALFAKLYRLAETEDGQPAPVNEWLQRGMSLELLTELLAFLLDAYNLRQDANDPKATEPAGKTK